MVPTSPMSPIRGTRRLMPDPGQEIEIESDCAAGCPLAMAYVPWQSWENTYEEEVAFKVGTVFPSLDLPFLGGKRI
ncbi:spore coat associated protein CotJA [Clostridium aminobutyricum]|uniref:Spore coat associated protein CotJA n=2 Tax=Clostridium aminobutyricum TaxID=33953 RepID=A0A939D8K8_CLOAM|nr:spore coat associated protein CotJA [Clostridium aminobutyricum]